MAASLVFFACPIAQAEQVVRVFDWLGERPFLLQPPGISMQNERTDPSGPGEELLIENRDTEPKTAGVFEQQAPGIAAMEYAVLGSIRYEDVAPGSYLEMWSRFPNGEAYFSRTLASSGLLQRIEGTSPWRAFSLPFVSNEKLGAPSMLKVNVVFAGKGKIWLSPLRLVQYAPGEHALMTTGEWWSDREGGWIGGIAGSVLGCLGGLIGTLAGLGKARWLVIALMWAILVSGIGCLLFGVVALSLGQPYAVYFPLLLLGLIASAVTGPQIPMVCRRYEQIELRRMAAMDATGSSR